MLDKYQSLNEEEDKGFSEKELKKIKE